ncbi:MAG: PAS domain S-box protein [Usitatibacteraceae bacterium]
MATHHGSTTGSLSRISIGIAICCLLLGAAAWIAAVALGDYERKRAIEIEVSQNADLALAFDAVMIRTLKAAEVVGRSFVRDFQRFGPAADAEQLFGDLALDRKLFTNVLIRDEEGKIVTGLKGAGTADGAHIEYFQYLKSHATEEVFIGKPAIGQTSGRWRVPVARRINKPDGSFGGVVAVGLDPSFLASFYNPGDIGKGNTVALVGLDGVVRIRKNSSDESAGGDLSKSPNFQRVLAERKEKSTGSYVAASTSDGISRIVSFRVMKTYPLVVFVGSNEHDVLAPVRQRALAFYVSALIVSLLALGAGAVAIFLLRKKAHHLAMLSESEARFRATFDQATIGMSTTDASGHYTAVNRSFCESMGYSREELIGQHYSKVTHPDDLASTQARREKMLAGEVSEEVSGEKGSMEKRFIHKNGELVWIKFSSALVPETAQTPAYFVSVVNDISGRRRAEHQVSLLENCVSRLNDIVIVTDARPDSEGGPRIVFVNDAFSRFTGYAREEVIGRSRALLGGSRTNQAEMQRVQSLLAEGKPASAEIIKYKKNAEPFWVELNIVPIYDTGGKLTNYASVERDVTERKRTEEVIKRTSRILQTLSQCNAALVRAGTEVELLDRMCDIAVATGGFKMAWVGYAMDDAKKTIVPQGRAGAEGSFLAGMPLSWSEQEVLGHGPAGTVVRTGQPMIVTDLDALSGLEPWLGEVTKRGFTGVISLPLTLGDQRIGVLMLYLGDKMDVHPEEFKLMQELAEDLSFGIATIRLRQERESAREDLVTLNAELESRVLQRTAQLQKANEELESFSYSISHDLRAPLRTVDGFSGLLLEDYSAQLPDDAKRIINVIRNGAQQMGQLIDDLLQFARTGHCAVVTTRLNTARLVAVALGNVSSSFPGREEQVRIGALPACVGDAALITQVWTNLLSNALKYTGKTAEPRIEVGATEVDGKAAYFVRDNGVGFDMQYVHKLFGVFERLHRSDEFPGTGVGLAIVQKVIQRHGGRVWAESEPGVATTFYFQLGEELNNDGR